MGGSSRRRRPPRIRCSGTWADEGIQPIGTHGPLLDDCCDDAGASGPFPSEVLSSWMSAVVRPRNVSTWPFLRTPEHTRKHS